MSKDFSNGFFCDRAMVWVVLPADKRPRSSWNGNTVVGHPGFDGVEFQVSAGAHGILAYYPNTSEIGAVAEDLEELVNRWLSDSIEFPF